MEANSSVYCFCTTLLWLVWTAILDKAWQLAILTWKNSTPRFQSQGVLQFLCLPTIYIPVSFGVCSFLIMLWLFRPHVAGDIIVLYPVTHAWNSWNLYCSAVTSIKNVLCISHQNFKRCPNRTNGRLWASSALKMWADPLLLLNSIFKMDPIQLWRFQWTWWFPTLILEVRASRMMGPVLKGQGPPWILCFFLVPTFVLRYFVSFG